MCFIMYARTTLNETVKTIWKKEELIKCWKGLIRLEFVSPGLWIMRDLRNAQIGILINESRMRVRK